MNVGTSQVEAAVSIRIPARDFRTVMLQTERMLLRSFVPGDAAEIFAHAFPAVSHYLADRSAPTPESFETLWRAWLEDLANGREATLVARDANTFEFLGVVGLHFTLHAEAEVGVWIKDSASGRGFGLEAVAAMIAWARRELGVGSVLFAAAESSESSRRIAEQAGGSPVGHRMQRHPSGTTTAMVVYRIPQSG